MEAMGGRPVCAAAGSLRRQATSNPGCNRFLDEVMGFVCGISQCGDHGVCDFASRGLAAQIRAMIGFVRHDCLDARQEAVRGLLLTKVIEQQRTGPEGPDRVSNSLACDIKSRTMDGLEHRRVLSLWVEVSRRRDAERTGQRRSKIGE